jgi:pimeloyl-ACP methyl ester carboxylesterase
MLFDAREQLAQRDENCRIAGSVTAARQPPLPIVVLLVREAEGGRAREIVDHFVLDRPGRWAFVASPGRYLVSAFEDRSRDLVYQPGEAHGSAGRTLACARSTRIDGVAVSIPAQAKDPFPHTLDVAVLQKRSLVDQAHRTLGQLTVAGEVISLSDARFSDAQAESAMWRPIDFVANEWAGVYFLEPYDPKKIPVLFVHGINGSPANFGPLLERLDRVRYQPWLYYYPSGIDLATLADHLDQTMAKLHLRYRFERLAVVAHSMGGLVSRGFIQRHALNARPARIALFMTMATPWGGHRGAEIGVRTSPVVLPVWRDMAPGSEYQRSLYAAPLPEGLQHHLVFTYNDETIPLASQLVPQAQRDAVRLYGFNETHMGVLRNDEVSLLLDGLLKGL